MSWLTQVFDFLRSKLAPLSLSLSPSIDLAPHDEGAPTKIHYILRYHKIVVIIKKKLLEQTYRTIYGRSHSSRLEMLKVH